MSHFSGADCGDPDASVTYLDRAVGTLPEAKSHMLELLAPRPGDLLLDLGCGGGRDVVALTQTGARVVGLDPDAQMASHTRWRSLDAGLNALVARASGEALPFADGVFDGCRIDRVLQHVPDPVRALAEARRVLRCGGRLVVFEPTWASLTVDAEDMATSEAVVRAFASRAHHPYLGLRLRRMLLDAGFSEARCTTRTSEFTTLESLLDAIDLLAAGEVARRAGTVTAEALERWWEDCSEASRSGRFMATLDWVYALAHAG